VAKPAEQTPLIATATVRLFHRAGVPSQVLHLLPGRGETIGAQLVAHPHTAGVVFTGSVPVAQQIHQLLSRSTQGIRPLIAETGGLNTMLVDATALTDQVVKDVIQSAFNSAGQRCSALRILCLHESIADLTISMLCGAMTHLVVGDPGHLDTDIGPVIDAAALSKLERHRFHLQQMGKIHHQNPLPPHLNGHYFAPLLAEIERLDQLTEEIFGPILHVVRFTDATLDALLDQINATGYGLTLGIHSRLHETIEHISRRMRVGNIYVNRNMIGAVVGVQPFGGVGLSGTGPKAGGPNYLKVFTYEQSLSTNTAAIGGDVELMRSKT
jgi:RHH-type transcriptional regulator, proline utilization regulon repressor / proline dehydrogenase / delta 1-pyrroline-5-carboxylate dehydrogenase